VEAARGHELVDLVRAEIAALRQEFVASLQLQQLQAGALGHPVAEPLMQALEQAGAPAGLRTLLLDTATAATDLADGVQRVHAALSAGLQAEALALPMTGLHALCGPSGAGKSLMAARWLQQAAQHHASSEPLVLIAYCDQRPGAWSQTQMLAAQLGVSAYRASSPDTLHTLLDELGERTLVLIDTPGTEPMGHAQTLQDRLPGVALHCVLPADASPATVRRFLHEARVPWHSLLVSKLDESEQPWGLVQQLCNHRLPISAMADSPHATAALQRWRPDALLDRALAPARVLAAAPPDATRLQAPPPHAPATLKPLLRPPRADSSAPLHPAGAAQNRLGAPPRTPPPAIVLNLQGPGRRRDDPSGPAAPRSRPRPQWVAA
jgi:flagellar biosynthesis protein FlhF